MAQIPLHDALNMKVPDMRQVLSAQLSSSSSSFSSFSSSSMTSRTSRTSAFSTPYTILSAWSSFEAEVEKFIMDQTCKFPGAMCNDARELRPNMWSRVYCANTEQSVQALFTSRILSVVSDVLEAIDCPGLNLGSTANSVYGIPDQIWVLEGGAPAVMCMEVKSPWYLKNVSNIIQQSLSTDCDENLRASIEQIYGYMALNNHKYGVLTTYESTWVFRRGADDNRDDPSHQALEVAGPFRTTPLSEILGGEDGGEERKISVIGALTFLLHQVKEDWMHSSQHDTESVAAALANQAPLVSSYALLTTAVKDQRIMLQDRLCVRGSSRIIKGKLHGRSEDVIFKTADCYNGRQVLHELENEVDNYKRLEKLQGNVIPKFLGYFNKGGLLQLMALENSGVDVTTVTEADKETMKGLLRKLHAEGFVHGDVALRNFVKDSSGKWWLIDLGRAKLTSDEDARRKDFNDLEEILRSEV